MYIYIYIHTHTHTYMYSFSYYILQFLFFKTYFLYLHWISHWVQWTYFWLCLTLYLISFLSLFDSVLFLRFCVLFGKYSFVFSFYLFFFVCFYILSIYATPVVFKNWPYVEGILRDSVAHFPLVTKARYFLVSLVWTVCNLFVWLGCNCCRYIDRRGLSSGPVALDTLVGKASPQASWLRGSDLDLGKSADVWG